MFKQKTGVKKIKVVGNKTDNNDELREFVSCYTSCFRLESEPANDLVLWRS